MKHHGIMLCVALLLTGIDVPAQDFDTIEASTEVEAVGDTCAALAVFAYARDRSYFTQALIARAIQNRIATLPSGADACDVVAVLPAVKAWTYPRNPWAIDSRGWRNAMEVVEVTFSGDYAIPPTFFAVDSFSPTGRAPAGRVPVGTVEGITFFVPVDEFGQTLLTTGETE